MKTFLKGLGLIAAANTVFTLARAFSFAAAGMAAARTIHQQLLGAVLAAPMAWFDTHPAGRVLNR
jgi:ATP-binding cassette subfamily C (CFTR/MRP) protein 10